MSYAVRATPRPAPLRLLGREIQVVLRNLRWAVVREGSPLATSTHDRRDDAVRAARTLAGRSGAPVVVFGLDGRPLPRA